MYPKFSPYLGRLLLLHFARFEQLGCPLGSCFSSRCRLLFKLCCLALHSMLVARLCVYMQVHFSPNLPCTSLPLSDVLQQNLLGGVQACFEGAIAWVFLRLEGEHSVDRGPLICWVDLNLQLFCSQAFCLVLTSSTKSWNFLSYL